MRFGKKEVKIWMKKKYLLNRHSCQTSAKLVPKDGEKDGKEAING